MERWFRRLRTLLFLLALMLVLQRSHADLADRAGRLRAFTRPLEFNYAGWMLDALMLKAAQTAAAPAQYLPSREAHNLVLQYLDLVRRTQELEAEIEAIYASPEVDDPLGASQAARRELDELLSQQRFLAPLVESILQDQLTTVAAEMGLTLGGLPVPPVLYHVTPLPTALIVSPREVIRQDFNISLVAGLTADQREALEAQVDRALNVSSLVVNVGGVGVYPTMVIQSTDLNWLVEVVAHEWVHNFLTLRPLGMLYESSPEMRIINETVASLAGKEIRDAYLRRFYPERMPSPAPPPKVSPSASEATQPPPFDFRAEMHKTRLRVDELLAQGKVEEAEAYMEARRLVFWENGYRLRKLNQAYFAFHGAYADTPGGAAGASEDPLGDAVRRLRAASPSLAEFLNRISWMWSAEQVLRAADRP
ncbi:MAG: hypothetical protein D6803_04730 [Anaerolineae bacterium]|nr:MAG: hypothetical protein D6803_04730 [Anaerolineae bacterium]